MPEFARFLAKKDKSLLEIEDKFIEEYVFDNPASHKWGISNMVKAISNISSLFYTRDARVSFVFYFCVCSGLSLGILS